MHETLIYEGERIGRDRVARLMAADGLYGPPSAGAGVGRPLGCGLCRCVCKHLERESRRAKSARLSSKSARRCQFLIRYATGRRGEPNSRHCPVRRRDWPSSPFAGEVVSARGWFEKSLRRSKRFAYNLAAVEIEKPASTRGESASEEGRSPAPPAGFNQRLAQPVVAVNG